MNCVRNASSVGNNLIQGDELGFDGDLEFRIASRIDGYVTSVKKINAENNNFAYAA